MKWKLFPPTQTELSGQNIADKKARQRGQTLIEFILLLMVITFVSFSFIRLTNSNLGKFWVAFAKIIVDDSSEAARISLP